MTPLIHMRAKVTNRGRDARYRRPPAHIPASPIRALGSYLGCVTAKRTSGQGRRMRGLGSQCPDICAMRSQVQPSF